MVLYAIPCFWFILIDWILTISVHENLSLLLYLWWICFRLSMVIAFIFWHFNIQPFLKFICLHEYFCVSGIWRFTGKLYLWCYILVIFFYGQVAFLKHLIFNEYCLLWFCFFGLAMLYLAPLGSIILIIIMCILVKVQQTYYSLYVYVKHIWILIKIIFFILILVIWSYIKSFFINIFSNIVIISTLISIWNYKLIHRICT